MIFQGHPQFPGLISLKICQVIPVDGRILDGLSQLGSWGEDGEFVAEKSWKLENHWEILWMEEILHQLVYGLSHCNPIIYSVL